MTAPTKQSVFDYAALDLETRVVVQQRTSEIKSLMKRSAQDIIEIGSKFAEVRDLLKHNKAGGFQGWFEAEGWQHGTVYNFIHVHEAFGNIPNFGKLDIVLTALYKLASPSTPDSAREEVMRLAAEGQQITDKEVTQIIAEHKPTAPEGYTVWYSTHRGTTYHLVESKGHQTACGKLTTYLDRKPRKGVTYHVCEKCQAKAAVPTPLSQDIPPSNEGQALHAAGIDDSTSPDEPVQRKTADGHWITEDGLILRYIPGTDRGWCPRCGDWSNFMLMGQDTWACKKCDWRVQDDAIRIWAPEPPDPTPHRPVSTPTILPDNMLADLQEAQRLLRKWWERLPSSSITRTYVDQALVNVGKAIVSAGKAPASAAFGKPAERITQ